MIVDHLKVCVDGSSLRLPMNRLTRPATAHTDPDCTSSPIRSMHEKLTGVLIILSILALILTF